MTDTEQGKEKKMVIDIHCHLDPFSQDGGCKISRKTANNYVFVVMKAWYGYWKRGEAGNFSRRMEELLAGQVRTSETTDLAVALAMDGVYDSAGRLNLDATHFYIPNDHMFDVVARHDELLAGASVNPCRADALDELDRVKQLGAVLIKLVPNIQGCDLSDKKYIPYFRKLAELKLPLLTHTGYEHCIPSVDQMYGNPARLETALAEGATVIAGHCGCSGHGHPVEFFGELVKMAEKYENLYADLSAISSISRFGYVSRILSETVIHDRLMQATDFPVYPMPFLFAHKIGPSAIKKIYSNKNIFDIDVRAKLALGFSEDILYRAAHVLGI